MFQQSFNLSYIKHAFNLDDIINNSSNVKGAKFKNLTIQTINGSSLNGNRVNLTDIYDLMFQNGDLATVAVTYPFGAGEVSFSISDAGSIVLFSNLSDNEYIALIEELMNL
ncbi:hypothetical protein [Dehalobacter sp. TeCB1]|uniref:hypothetical protein n=1 Tax=Dehalobacter sp. TeCB1 TaxID=1843715 RepID=UPI0009F5FEDC|nr:hypothetical protein [Dehalobacter sp. TeCB1]